jgi:predicted metal-dependent HD superfamily phosphohydrolase
VTTGLLQRWRGLAGNGADALGAALIEAWNEPHRFYHGQNHLLWLLDEAERRSALIADRAFVGYAIWFHDAVYQPGQADNESRSADWARDALGNKVLGERVGIVVEMTKNHLAGEACGDEALFLDMDIAILGAPRQHYAAYVVGVRREFNMYPDAAFAAGRAHFLELQLKQERLFRTEQYHRELSANAHANITWELEALRRGQMVQG